MTSLRDLPIKRKLTLITMLTTGVALLLACATLVTYERVTFRRTMTRNLSMLAEMIDDSLAPGLAFNDRSSLDQTLRSMVADPHILAAAVYDKSGTVVSRYQRRDLNREFAVPAVQENGCYFRADRVDTFQKIKLAGEAIGAVYIASDLQEMSDRLRRYLLIVGLVLAVASVVAFLVSAKLQGVISEPISHLAQVAGVVANGKDYSIRAHKQNNDELGRLIDGFNAMLEQIQHRDNALRDARDNLEGRVEARTRELQLEIVERTEAEAKLGQSVSLGHATLEATADGILAVDRQGKIVAFNNKFVEMWRISRDILNSGDDKQALGTVLDQLTDPEGFLGKVRQLYSQPDAESFDVLEFKDGRVFERWSKPQRIGESTTGRVWCFRDVTARKQAEAQLDKAHRELLEASRLAGRAEVATGVLHNVGNVLNSVNVSATLIADQVRKSKSSSLGKLAALLHEHAADLGAFLTTDPRGKQLPGYVGQLSDHLAGEQETLLQEVEALRKNVEHIKEIVAMQQNYAKVSGVAEIVKLPELVEDALRLNSGALDRHVVQAIREFEDVPPITVDRHKVFQILVNLLRNAKYACDDSGRVDKRITIRVANGGERVRIVVSDNGVGIPAENLTRIFAHGFTTRKDGHGFGLHSGALAAKEMGGSLKVQSAGVGHGATFTLELPLNRAGRDVTPATATPQLAA